nr:vacuolar transporter chaperone 2 [Quercus suber]
MIYVPGQLTPSSSDMTTKGRPLDRRSRGGLSTARNGREVPHRRVLRDTSRSGRSGSPRIRNRNLDDRRQRFSSWCVIFRSLRHHLDKMRFGRTLELATYAPWKGKYIDYAKLKKLLRDDESAPNSPTTETKGATWSEDDEGAFVDELVNQQLEKVHAFHKDTYEKLRDRTAKCEAKLDLVVDADRGDDETEKEDGNQEPREDGQDSEANAGGSGLLSKRQANGNGKKPMPSDAEKQKILGEVLSELDDITKETNELEKYSRINYTGFLKAAKKHDRKRGHSYRVRPLLQVRLAALPFNKEDYSPLLYRLSAMYSFVRQHLESPEKRGLSISEPQEGRDEYVSHKFWVHPENLLEVKTLILRRLPVLVYNPQTSKVAEGHQADPSITSIYFDNPAFSLYTNKVDDNVASSLRLRWYGRLNEKPEIWVDKKTVNEDNTSQESRFSTKEKYVQRFIKNEYHMEKQISKLDERTATNSDAAKQLQSSVEEIQKFIMENDLQPMLRANYTRTAFQIPGDDRVRISLDTDLAFIREDAIDERPCRDPETWHRTDIDNNELEYPFSSIRKGEINRFPFALLEIKLRNADKKTEWVEDLMNSHLVKQSPRFSKFVHGVAELFEDYVNTFPFWLSELDTDIRRDPHQAFEDEQAKKQKERDDEFAVGSLLKSPMHRGHQGAVLSPVGSPSLSQIMRKSPHVLNGNSKNNVGKSVNTSSSQTQETAEEPDDDETGQQTHGTERQTTPGGLKNLFPSISSSKYAQARRSGKVQLPPGVSKPANWIKDQGPVKVEAKVWLANQRTFIKWQHVSVLLATLSLGLYNAAGVDNNVARALAVVYTIIALLTGAWGYGIYMWRTSLIERRSGKDFDAIAGPVVVCVGLMVALILNFAFKYQAMINDRTNDSGAQHNSTAIAELANVAGAIVRNQTEYLLKYDDL